jgi:hypothetical protein
LKKAPDDTQLESAWFHPTLQAYKVKTWFSKFALSHTGVNLCAAYAEDKEKKTDLELNDVFFLHDKERDGSYWHTHTHSMQHLAVRGAPRYG